jgi:diadenosine tetraphosphatase ApaH/serine/threonine PP2A family protein phosphatase
VALDAVLDSLGSVDAIWHLGDVVGYGPEPNGVVERLTSVKASGVRGNHDAAALGGREIDWFNPDARAAMEWTISAIQPSTRAWLEKLPESHVDDQFTLVHGSPRDPMWEYVTSAAVARANLAVLRTPFGLHGHTHVPIVFRGADRGIEAVSPTPGARLTLDERPALINPGSVGQPRDGDPSASYAVLDTATATFSWHRVTYDIKSVQAAMSSLRLPARLVDRLSFGV